MLPTRRVQPLGLRIGNLVRLLVLLLLVASAQSSATSSTSTSSVSSPSTAAALAPTATTKTATGSNPVIQLAHYIKKSVVKTIDGCGELWSNHGRCNDIRKKMQAYRNLKKDEWEAQGLYDKAEMKERVKAVQGGISFEEYNFLQKGKEDRGKVMNLVFLMWGMPRFLPYALMFNPDMLPSPFSSDTSSTSESALQKQSRERSAAVIEMLLSMEKNVATASGGGFMSKVLPFVGKKGRTEQQEQLQKVYQRTSQLLQTTPGTGTLAGANQVLGQLEPLVFKSPDDFDRRDKRLVHVPACITQGVGNIVAPMGFVGSVLPNFIRRGRLLGHLRKVTDADDFLVQAEIDLTSINKRLLIQACADRLLSGPGRTEDDLRQSLQDWLTCAVHEPAARLRKDPTLHYNGNMCRLALMAYYSCLSVRDPRSECELPRLLFSTNASGSNTLEESGMKTEHKRFRKFFSSS